MRVRRHSALGVLPAIRKALDAYVARGGTPLDYSKENAASLTPQGRPRSPTELGTSSSTTQRRRNTCRRACQHVLSIKKTYCRDQSAIGAGAVPGACTIIVAPDSGPST